MNVLKVCQEKTMQYNKKMIKFVSVFQYYFYLAFTVICVGSTILVRRLLGGNIRVLP